MNWKTSIMVALCFWAAMEANCTQEKNASVASEVGKTSEVKEIKKLTQEEINELYAKANEIWDHFGSHGMCFPDSTLDEVLCRRISSIRNWIDNYIEIRELYDRGGETKDFAEFYHDNSDKSCYRNFPSLEHYAKNLKEKAGLVSMLADRAERMAVSERDWGIGVLAIVGATEVCRFAKLPETFVNWIKQEHFQEAQRLQRAKPEDKTDLEWYLGSTKETLQFKEFIDQILQRAPEDKACLRWPSNPHQERHLASIKETLQFQKSVDQILRNANSAKEAVKHILGDLFPTEISLAFREAYIKQIKMDIIHPQYSHNPYVLCHSSIENIRGMYEKNLENIDEMYEKESPLAEYKEEYLKKAIADLDDLSKSLCSGGVDAHHRLAYLESHIERMNRDLSYLREDEPGPSWHPDDEAFHRAETRACVLDIIRELRELVKSPEPLSSSSASSSSSSSSSSALSCPRSVSPHPGSASPLPRSVSPYALSPLPRSASPWASSGMPPLPRSASPWASSGMPPLPPSMPSNPKSPSSEPLPRPGFLDLLLKRN